MNPLIQPFIQALLSFDQVAARELFAKEAKHVDSLPLIEQVVVPSLEYIGREWEAGNLALAQVYMSGKICEQLVNELLPASSPERISEPPMAIALLADYHSLGKTIIAAALRASGFAFHDFGRVEADELVSKVTEHGVRILLISALMLPSALQVKTVCEALRKTGADTKIIVGGAPFRLDRQLWREVGADAMGADTAEAIAVVSQMIKEHV